MASSSQTNIQMKFLLVLTCIVSLKIVESTDPMYGHPLLVFPPNNNNLPYKQDFFLQNWKDCHDALLNTGGCLADIFKLIHGIGIPTGGGGGGGLPLGDTPPAAGPAGGASTPSGGPPTTADEVQAADDAGGAGAAAASGGGSGGLFPDIGSWFPGIPGLSGAGGLPGGLPDIGGAISPSCCDALAGVQKSCPGVTLNPFFGPLVSKHCPPK